MKFLRLPNLGEMLAALRGPDLRSILHTALVSLAFGIALAAAIHHAWEASILFLLAGWYLDWSATVKEGTTLEVHIKCSQPETASKAEDPTP